MDLKTAGAALGLDAARAAEPARYAIGGVAPRVAVRPESREEAAEALRAASRDALAVVPWGGGAALPHEAPPARYDVALDLTGVARIVEYEPADLTLTAECGITIAALRQALAEHGQELPIEAAFAERATLGGALAANASGPRRRRFGAPRDRILGARYLLGDGGGARTGGKVVKNVAGYGLHRMLCGSRGALAVLLEASLKLQPAPALRRAWLYPCGADQVRDRARHQTFARLELAAFSVLSAGNARVAGLDAGGGDHVAIVGFEEEPAWVAEQERAVRAALGTPATVVEGAEAAALWQKLADLEEQPGPRLVFATAEDSPAAIAPLLSRVTAARYSFRCASGRLLMWPGGGEAAEIAALLADAHFTLVDVRGAEDFEWPVAPAVAVRALRARLRDAIDPGARFAYGERWVEGWR